jgi:hypothetical protein
MSSPLFARVVAQAELDEALRREMLALMRVCYEGVSSERFAADLASKQHVILLFVKGTRRLVGFSTLKIVEERLDGRTVDLAYSGDTVIHPEFWGTKTLQSAFARSLLRLKLRHPFRPCLWLLLSGGYKTYLIMVNNLPRSFPNRRYTPDTPRRRFLESIAREWFGEHYDSIRGIVHLGADHYRVRAGVAPIDPETARRPDVAYFLEHNPGHASGDELVCLAEFRLRDFLLVLARIAVAQARLSTGATPRPVSARAQP